MFGDTLTVEHAAAVTQLHGALDVLCSSDLTGCTDEQALGLWREMEAVRRRLAPVDHAVIAEVQARHLDATTGAKTMPVLARQMLRIGVREAAARVRAAEALAPRRSFTGEPLAPIYRQVAAAQAEGTVSDRAAQVIVGLIEKLPPAIRCEQDEQIEQFLTEQAAILDLDGLRQVAHRLELTLDPDGKNKDIEYRRRHRDLRFCVRPDGSAHFEGEATAELVELARTMLEPFAKPKPATSTTDSDSDSDGGSGEGAGGPVVTMRDTRTYGQRMHDALLEAFRLLARTGQVPDSGGITTTVLLTMSASDFAAGTGIAITGHNVIVPVPEAFAWCGGDTTIVFPIRQGDRGELIEVGTGQRLFSKRQRLAMIARDKGCSFPDCDIPPQWTQAHHVIEYQDDGPTSTDNGTLLCGHHHREFANLGWTVRMNQGVPEWLAPIWLDPTQTPRRNRAHHPTLA